MVSYLNKEPAKRWQTAAGGSHIFRRGEMLYKLTKEQLVPPRMDTLRRPRCVLVEKVVQGLMD